MNTTPLILIYLGLVVSGVAVVFGRLMPLLWPNKVPTKAHDLLSLVWTIGFVLIAVGVLAGCARLLGVY